MTSKHVGNRIEREVYIDAGFFKKFVYLFKRVRGRVYLFGSPNAPNGPRGQGKGKPGVGNSIHVSHMGGRNPVA